MNIKQAKEQIFHAITAYRTRDEYGRPVIAQQRQRPVFLMGAPGIGKTAIMEQIAQEMGIPLVSYSMTHHTRQSALGLPFIREKEYDDGRGGRETFRVSEYTMSEIIAAVYDRMEQTGAREGILFLDEINCVSETLAPAMLQFLQYKVFGQHKMPEGWILVTAGNPPEYNQSVREFDMVTWDRLKRIDVEPDFDVWRAWAVDQGVHPAVLSYLDVRKSDFYQVESTVDGKSFVTPRGWVDLSDMLKLYEQHSITVDGHLTGQYLQDGKISKSFANYYDLWLKYRGDYQIEAILNGKTPKQSMTRAKAAKFDERISLVGLLLDAMLGKIRPVMNERAVLEETVAILKNVKRDNIAKKRAISVLVDEAIRAQEKKLAQGLAGGMLSRAQESVHRAVSAFLMDGRIKLQDDMDDATAFASLKADFDGRTKAMKKQAETVGKQLENLFAFAEEAFGDGQEMLVIVTELTAAADAARFIAQYGSPAYFRHNKSLLFYERQVKIISEIDQLDDDMDTDDSAGQKPAQKTKLN